MDTTVDDADSELEKHDFTKQFYPKIPSQNVCKNESIKTISDSETRPNDRKSEKTFLKSNYKYKRRSLVLSDANCCFLIVSEVIRYLREVHRYARCLKMLNNCPIGCVLLTAIVMSLGFTHMTEAGACWVERMDNGKCKELYSKNVSREECCGRSQEFAYTEKDMSDAEYFFTAAIGGGTACVSCLDSCEVAKCGPEKRCVIRKSRPKCICAPKCKASKENKLKKQSIRVIDVTKNEKSTQFNFGIPLTREIRSLSEVEQSQLGRETENSRLHIKKNQRKKNSLRRRKKKMDRMRQRNEEGTQLSNQGKPKAKLKHDRYSMPGGDGQNLGKLENSVRNKKKVNASSSDGAVHDSQYSNYTQHHTRHHSKNHRKIKEQKTNIQNITASRKQKPFYMQTGITLDEKIRNGFFNHGFPYPPNDLTQVTLGRYFNPVCGTDGKSYKTECQLKKRACRQGSTSLTVAYRGQCQTSCKLVDCLHGLTCVEDQYGIPHCISCTITCPRDDASSSVDPSRAVCGVDGRTYKSVCDINRMICTTGRSIAVAYNGPCQDEANCNNIHCGDREICLTDLVTHKPRCVSCSFKCPRRRRPQGQRYEDVKICGNNNHTYQSWCQMRRDSCNTEFYIDVKHVGVCHKDSFTTSIV